MKVVIEQSELKKERITYQEEVPYTIKCRRCKYDTTLIMQVEDENGEIVLQREQIENDARNVNDTTLKIFPHDASVISIYLCTKCGRMRATWNQG